jgi:hypothetical protein
MKVNLVKYGGKPREIRYENEQKHNFKLYEGEIKKISNSIQVEVFHAVFISSRHLK